MPIEIGKTYNRLTVLYQCEEPYINPKGIKSKRFHVRCNCNKHTEFDVVGNYILAGKVKSCGCLRSEKVSERMKQSINHPLKNINNPNLPPEEVTTRYDLSGEYGIGYTYNTDTPFYFDLEDYDKIKDYQWRLNDHGYIDTVIGLSKAIYMHRLVMGLTDEKLEVDHKFHNITDNRKQNLRVCSRQENGRSAITPSNNTSGKKGVSYQKTRDKWRAYITIDNKQYYLGSFTNYEDAVKAREEAEQKIFKEYNYIESDKGYYTIEETT